MKVLQVIPSIDPSYGGPLSVLKGLAGNLKNLGVRPEILTCSTGDTSLDREHALSFPDIDIAWIKPMVKRYYWTPFLSSTIENHLKKYALLHVHGVFNGLSSSVCRAARALHIPYILEPFGTLSPYCLAKSSLLKKTSLALGERKNIESAAAIKFSSAGEQQRFNLNFHNSYSFVIGNGLDWTEFGQLPTPGKFRERYNISELDTVFLFLGRLQPIKGLEVFLPAFAQWKKMDHKRNNIRFVLIGPDEAGYKKKLENRASQLGIDDAVLFLGPLYGSDRVQALVDSDVVVLPSYHENYGLTAVEGMACGKPILITDQVDIWPEVRKYDCGEIGTPTLEGLTDALKRMHARKQEWPDIGKNGRNWAQENCNWEEIAAIIFNKYREIHASSHLPGLL